MMRRLYRVCYFERSGFRSVSPPAGLGVSGSHGKLYGGRILRR